MERTKVIRGLRIAWTVAWAILCVLLVVLWALSYLHMDIVAISNPPDRFLAVSYYGRIYGSKVELAEAVSKPHAVDTLNIHDDRNTVQDVIDDLFDDSG